MISSAMAGPSLRVTGRFFRVARLRDEYYDFIDSPSDFVASLKTRPNFHAHLFSFVQPISQCTNYLNYYFEMDSAAVLNITTYEKWWKLQINDKTRNKIGRAHVRTPVTATSRMPSSA